jgi:carbon-monoxide dehydrogenase large subunit
MESPRAISKAVGEPVKRVEDPRLLAGQGRYVDDLRLPRMVSAAFVQSPHAHARLRRVDASRAAALPGVVGVLTGEEAARRCRPWRGILTDYVGMKTPLQYPLAVGKVRYVGEPVVAIAAVDRYVAEDACDLVEVEYEPLPAVVDPEAAMRPGAPLIDEDAGDNVIYRGGFDKGEVDRAFAEAHRVYRERFVIGRQTCVALEPRSLVAAYEPTTQSMTLWISSQVPHMMQAIFSRILSIEEQKLRVIAPDVGGSFGLKIHCYSDDVAACLLAIKLGRPVKWIADRVESFATDIHCREHVVEVEAAVGADGTVLALRSRAVAGVGPWSCYPRSSVVEGNQVIRLLTGPYRIRNYKAELAVVAQNKALTSQYRAVGHPIATMVMESLLDRAARDLGVDPVEIRKRNLVRRHEFPYTTAYGYVYESGSYVESLDLVVEKGDYAGWRREQARARAEGRFLGLGLSCFIELTAPGSFYGSGGAPVSAQEGATIRLEPTGKVTALVGVTNQGQGAHTAFAQVIADELGVPVTDVNVMSGDTALVPYGGGTSGSRGAVLGAGASILACRGLRTQIARVAASMLEAAPGDIEIAGGKARVRGAPHTAVSLAEVAWLVYYRSDKLPRDVEPSLEATSHYTPERPLSWTNGAHLAVVEVDVETGLVRILKYTTVEDCGTIINPALVAEQVRGGVAQGIGSALYEHVVYDDHGQLQTRTLMDYLVPGSAEMPDIEVHHLETPSPFTVGGFKGVGEAGTTGAPAAIVNAVNDALAPLGVRLTRQPITPDLILGALRATRTPSP